MEGVVTEVPKIEAGGLETERNIKLMRGFFPENSHIYHDQETRSYRAEFNLLSDVCDGGQFVSMELLVDEENSGEAVYLTDYLKHAEYITLQINRFSVNGQNVIDGVNLRITSLGDLKLVEELLDEKELKDYNLITPDKDAFFQPENEAFCNILEKSITLRRLKTADDLVSFFHERGHILREDEDLTFDQLNKDYQILGNTRHLLLEDNRYMSKLVRDGIVEIDHNFGLLDLQTYKRVLFEERRADLKSLRMLKERYQKIFPNDPNLLKAKLLLGAALSTQFGRNDKDESINRSLVETIKPEIETILDFDKDWHY